MVGLTETPCSVNIESLVFSNQVFIFIYCQILCVILMMFQDFFLFTPSGYWSLNGCKIVNIVIECLIDYGVNEEGVRVDLLIGSNFYNSNLF